MSDVDWGVAMVAICCGAGFAAASVLWQVLWAPQSALTWLDRRPPTDDRADTSTLTALRWALAVLVVLAGFVAGASITFVTNTP